MENNHVYTIFYKKWKYSIIFPSVFVLFMVIFLNGESQYALKNIHGKFLSFMIPQWKQQLYYIFTYFSVTIRQKKRIFNEIVVLCNFMNTTLHFYLTTKIKKISTNTPQQLSRT